MIIDHDVFQRIPDPIPNGEKYFFQSLGCFEYKDEADIEIKKILEEIESVAIKNNLEIWYHFSKLDQPEEILKLGLNMLGKDLTSTARLMSPSELMSQKLFKFQAIHPNVPIDTANSLLIILIPKRRDRREKDWYLGGDLDQDKSAELLEHVSAFTYRLPSKFIYGYFKKNTHGFMRNINFNQS